MNTEIYFWTRKEFEQNKAIMVEKNINSITYVTENVYGNLYLPNSFVIIGSISFINNLFFTNLDSYNTSIGTIVTKDGSIVFNLNYVIKFMDSKPDENLILTSKPTFVSGKYLTYKNIEITIQILKLTGERILAIEYQ
jgi:hypothetical protein